MKKGNIINESLKKLKIKIEEVNEKGIFKSIAYLLITIIVIMFPVIYRCIVALLCADLTEINLWIEFETGNFFLYALSLLAPMLFIVKCLLEQEYINVNINIKFPFLESLAAIIVSLLCYVVIQNNHEKIDDAMLVKISLVVFVWAIILAYKIHRFEAENTKSPNETRDANVKKISDGVDNLEDEETGSRKKKKGKDDGTLDEKFDEMEDIE